MIFDWKSIFATLFPYIWSPRYDKEHA